MMTASHADCVLVRSTFGRSATPSQVSSTSPRRQTDAGNTCSQPSSIRGPGLLAFAPPANGDVILDVAAGTGAVAHAASHIAGPGGRVIASDISPLMLAESRQERTDDRAAVESLESPADHLALPDGSVDVVY